MPELTVPQITRLLNDARSQAREQERERCAQAIEIHANTIGGIIGATLYALAADIRGTIVPSVRVADPEKVAAAAAEVMGRPEPPEETPEQRAIRMQMQQREIERLSREFAEEDAAIDAARAARPVVVDEPISELPPDRQHSDDDDIAVQVAAARRRRW